MAGSSPHEIAYSILPGTQRDTRNKTTNNYEYIFEMRKVSQSPIALRKCSREQDQSREAVVLLA